MNMNFEPIPQEDNIRPTVQVLLDLFITWCIGVGRYIKYCVLSNGFALDGSV